MNLFSKHKYKHMSILSLCVYYNLYVYTTISMCILQSLWLGIWTLISDPSDPYKFCFYCPATHVTSQVLQPKSVHKRYRGRHTFISLYCQSLRIIGNFSNFLVTRHCSTAALQHCSTAALQICGDQQLV